MSRARFGSAPLASSIVGSLIVLLPGASMPLVDDCQDGAACSCDYTYEKIDDITPPACHDYVDVFFSNAQLGCCTHPSGCSHSRPCSGIIGIRAHAKAGQTCQYQISGNGSQSDCVPGGCSTLTLRSTYSLTCGDDTPFQVIVTDAGGTQHVVTTVTLECLTCPG